MVPYFFSSASHPASAPGTVTVSTPRAGISLPPAREQRFARHERAGASAGIDRDEPMLLRDPHRREHVAAHPRHHRLGHGEHGRGGDRRVDRVAAGSQHRQPGRARERLAGGDDAVRSVHHRAPGSGERTLRGKERRHTESEQQKQ